MTKQEAIDKANSNEPIPTRNGAPFDYTIPFDMAELAKSLVGKTLSNPAKPGATLTITDWIGSCYVIQINGGDDYTVSPVLWILKNIDRMQVS